MFAMISRRVRMPLFLALSLSWTALADDSSCSGLALSREKDVPLIGSGLFLVIREKGSIFSSYATDMTFNCNGTTISNRNGQVFIVGKTFADAVKQANRLQPYLYFNRQNTSQVVKVVLGTDRVTVNAGQYPLSDEAIGFSLDQGNTLRPLLLEGRVSAPMRFSKNDVAVVFTDGEAAVWGQASLNPGTKTIVFRP